jgi:23S rRNA (uridine2552-2'-O)-methyltransferase
VKIFQGKDSEMVLQALRERFEKVKLFKPPSSRKGSSEIYAVCRGYRREASSTASMNM